MKLYIKLSLDKNLLVNYFDINKNKNKRKNSHIMNIKEDINFEFLEMTKIVITGFGVFSGVKDNPSKRIVEELQESQFSCENGTDIEFRILDVSVECCSQLHKQFTDPTSNSDVLFIHIGVDSKSTVIKLEQCAYNNMSFRVPDVCGYQPQECLITEEGKLDEPLFSELPLQRVCDELNATYSVNIEKTNTTDTTGGSTQLPLVMLSEDPGRYLCNYVYFQAMRHQKQLGKPMHAVFVHVPPFESVAQDTQVAVVRALVSSLCAHTVSV